MSLQSLRHLAYLTLSFTLFLSAGIAHAKDYSGRYYLEPDAAVYELSKGGKEGGKLKLFEVNNGSVSAGEYLIAAKLGRVVLFPDKFANLAIDCEPISDGLDCKLVTKKDMEVKAKVKLKKIAGGNLHGFYANPQDQMMYRFGADGSVFAMDQQKNKHNGKYMEKKGHVLLQNFGGSEFLQCKIHFGFLDCKNLSEEKGITGKHGFLIKFDINKTNGSLVSTFGSRSDGVIFSFTNLGTVIYSKYGQEDLTGNYTEENGEYAITLHQADGYFSCRKSSETTLKCKECSDACGDDTLTLVEVGSEPPPQQASPATAAAPGIKIKGLYLGMSSNEAKQALREINGIDKVKQDGEYILANSGNSTLIELLLGNGVVRRVRFIGGFHSLFKTEGIKARQFIQKFSSAYKIPSFDESVNGKVTLLTYLSDDGEEVVLKVGRFYVFEISLFKVAAPSQAAFD